MQGTAIRDGFRCVAGLHIPVVPRSLLPCARWKSAPHPPQRRLIVLPVRAFDDIVLHRGSSPTLAAYGGDQLSSLTPSLRGLIIEDLARLVDREIHPASAIEDAIPGECVNGHRRGRSRAEYDWSRDGLRIECKSAMMVWRPSAKRWAFEFTAVKQAHDVFDELWLALYTPDCIYFYRHDGKFCLAKCGLNTVHYGHRIVLAGSKNEYWTASLRTVMGRLRAETNGCTFLYSMPLTDDRIGLVLGRRRENIAQRVFWNAPLGRFSPTERATIIEAIIRRIDGFRNPHSYITDAVLGYRVNGSRRSIRQAEYDWRRDGLRIECKSGQLRWDLYWRRWKAVFSSIKMASSSAAQHSFDELFLGLYTPRGIYVFKHDLRFALSSCGCKTDTVGYQIQVYGPCGEVDWASSLNVFLAKLDASGCERIAFVEW